MTDWVLLYKHESSFTEVELYEARGNSGNNSDQFRLLLRCQSQPLTVDGVEKDWEDFTELVFTGPLERSDFISACIGMAKACGRLVFEVEKVTK